MALSSAAPLRNLNVRLFFYFAIYGYTVKLKNVYRPISYMFHIFFLPISYWSQSHTNLIVIIRTIQQKLHTVVIDGWEVQEIRGWSRVLICLLRYRDLFLEVELLFLVLVIYVWWFLMFGECFWVIMMVVLGYILF